MQARPKEYARADGLAENEGADERADDRLDARHDAGLAAFDVGKALGVEDVGATVESSTSPAARRAFCGTLRTVIRLPVGDEQRAERGEHERPEHDASGL